jgi:very-short-patch-repair endonuclease
VGWSLFCVRIRRDWLDSWRITRAFASVSLAAMPVEPSFDPHIEGESTARPWERAIADLADRQHGVVGRGQLLGMGMGGGAVDGRVARGALHVVQRGVYTVGCRALDREGRWMAAVLAGGPGAVLSHRSAGELWGLLAPGSGPVEITRSGGPRIRRPGIAAHESELAADEIAYGDGIPATSPFRTLFDLAGVLSARRLERALNEADVRQLLDRVSLPQLLDRHPGRRGVASLRALLEERGPDGVTRNDFEEAFVALLDASGLPRPRLNADLALRGQFFEIDCLWQEQQLVAELDGRAVHGTPRAFETDRRRDRILLAEGWHAMRVTWRQLRDEPTALVSDLRPLLTGRAGI